MLGEKDKHFYEGQPLSASQMTRIINELAKALAGEGVIQTPVGPVIVQRRGGGGGGTDVVILKYTGSRSDALYTGKVVDEVAGTTTGSTIEFIFPNDPGVDDLLGANHYVLARECPEWHEDDEVWSGDNDRYWAFMLWAAIR